MGDARWGVDRAALTPHRRWVSGTAKFVALGSNARGTGTLQVYELDGASLQRLSEAEKPHPLKCGTFGASGRGEGTLATGDFKGQLQAWDVARPSDALWTAQAHAGVINGIDGFGGEVRSFAVVGALVINEWRWALIVLFGMQSLGRGAPEIVTGGSDGAVAVCDPRQPQAAVAQFISAGGGSPAAECWCVAFGNASDDAERCVLAGGRHRLGA